MFVNRKAGENEKGHKMLNRISHTTDTDTRTLEQRAKDHARNLDVNAGPLTLQRWAVRAKELLEKLLESKGNV